MGSTGQQSQEETLPGELGEMGARRSEMLEPGSQLGRYLVLRRLGSGGMGEVYAAYDPTLDRQIALKIVRFDEGRGAEAARLRLAREAQAMAKVRHPNVIVVHDVGTHDGRLYIAMEFIEGITLTMLLEESRGWEEVLEVYRSAGSGLAAAHRRKVVHRDFKPENVMVDEDGRVVVLDFGLARAASGEPEARRLDETDGLSTQNSLLDQGVTRSGALPGTPAYMSPEQFAGAEANEQSDQFSFCVSLYQGLYGERPFAGESTAAIAFNISQGVVRPASTRAVPKWVRAAIVRGLSADVAGRWPSMGALLEALDSRRRKRRRLAVGLAGAGVVAVGLGVGLASVFTSQRQCSGAQAALQGVWDDDVRARADAQIASLDLQGKGELWELTRGELDAYAESWKGEHRDACEDTNVRKEQSAEGMDLRMACLNQAKLDFEATVGEILEIDDDGIVHLSDLVAGLPEIERCSDASWLEGRQPPPPGLEPQIATLRGTMAQHRAALRRAAPPVEALQELEPEILAVSYSPLHGEFYKLLGDTLNQQQRVSEGTVAHEKALKLALADGSNELAIETLLALASSSQVLLTSSSARAFATVASGLAGGDVSPRAKRLSRLAVARSQESSGEYDPAIETLRELLPLIPEGGARERGMVLKDLGMLLETQERFDESREAYAAASKELRGVLGDTHSEIAHIEMLLGLIAMREDDLDLAEEQFERALEIQSAFYGEGHPAAAGNHANLGTLYARQGRNDEAVAQYERVLDLIAEDDPRVALIEQNLGALAYEEGEFETATKHFRRAIEITVGTQGDDHPRTVMSHSALGRALQGMDRAAEAEPHHRTAVRLAQSAHGDDHATTITVRGRLGHNLVLQGKNAEAIAVLQATLADAPDDTNATRLAEMRFDLAQALWKEGERAQARALAGEAKDAATSDDQKGEIESWIADHR